MTYIDRTPDGWRPGQYIHIEPSPETKAAALTERRRVIEALVAEHPEWDELEIHDAMVAQTGSGAVPEEIRAVLNERR